MASAEEQFAKNFSFGAMGKAEELKSRIWFTLGILIVYRLGTYVPVPGIDPVTLQQIFEQQQGGILGMFDMLSGGALSRMSIFALNIMPYISASIIMQLMVVVIPTLEAIKKEGPSGQMKINQYTRWLTVMLAAFQGWGLAVGLESMQVAGQSAVIEPGIFFRTATMVTIVGGTVFLMWLGEQITQRGIGNGISLIIFSGIVANLPSALVGLFELGRTGALSTALILGFIIMALAVIYAIVFVERAQRRVVVQYPRRQHGNKVFGGDSSHLPIKINIAGVIPPIFAGSLLLMPVTMISFSGGMGPEWLQDASAMLGRGQPLYLGLYAGLIVFFAFFYTTIMFNPEDTSENLRQNGGFIPGIRPGASTATYLENIATRLTVVGSIYLVLICMLPEILISKYGVPFYFGGTSLLIVVTVTMDTVTQVQSHLIAHQYEGLIKKSKLAGKRRT